MSGVLGAIIGSFGRGIPDAPTIGTATDVGTARPFISGAATVTFTPNGSATSYTVRAYNASNVFQNITATGASSPITITGLQSGGVYKYTVFATNAAGNSTESGFTNTVTATTVPAAPTITSASNLTNQPYTGTVNVRVEFSVPATGGKPISFYNALSSSGNTGQNITTPVSVTETVGNPISPARTYTLTATNANGTSNPSNVSSTWVAFSQPQAPTIGTATATSATSASVTFTTNATGGRPLTRYRGSSTPTTTFPSNTVGSPLVFPSLIPNTPYTFTIQVDNVSGTISSASAASNSITTTSPNSIAVAHTTTPFVSAYPWFSGGLGTKYANPATTPTSDGRGVAFRPQGDAIAVAHPTAPRISAYPWSSGFGTKYADPATTPTSDGRGVAFI